MTAINWRRPRKRFTCWVSTKASCKSRAMKVGVFKEGFTRGRMEVTCCFLNLRCVLFSQCLPRILCCFITFLRAPKHVFKRLCPSVGWLLSHSFYDPHGARFVLFGLVWRLLDTHLFPSPPFTIHTYIPLSELFLSFYCYFKSVHEMVLSL